MKAGNSNVRSQIRPQPNISGALETCAWIHASQDDLHKRGFALDSYRQVGPQPLAVRQRLLQDRFQIPLRVGPKGLAQSQRGAVHRKTQGLHEMGEVHKVLQARLPIGVFRVWRIRSEVLPQRIESWSAE